MLNREKEIREIIDEYTDLFIEIVDVDMPGSKSCSMKSQNGNYYIALDLSRIDSSEELKTVVLHELGHCCTDSFYDADANLYERISCEYQAVRWAVLHCVPFDKYIDAIRDGVRDIYDLSEYFGITLSSARKVIDFYESRMLDYIRLSKEVVV